MNKVSVDVVDNGVGDGRHAAIRIMGLPELPADPTFRIDPIDEALVGSGEVDWPAGPRRPQTVAVYDGGVDLVLGPDVLESPLLLPGTPVVISITNTSIVKELVWPAITSRAHRTKRPVIVTDELRNAERNAHEVKRREASQALAANLRLAETEAAAGGRMRAATGRAVNPRLVVNNPLSFADDPSFGSGLSGLNLPPPATGSAATLLLKDGKPVPLPSKGTALAALPSSDTAPSPSARRQVAAFFCGVAAAAMLVFGLVQIQVLQWRQPLHTASGNDAALVAARATGSLRSVLATGGTSPRGRKASGIDGTVALSLADKYLHGAADTKVDQGEASFWLRHALSQSLDQGGMRWALTQLGSLYAAADGFEPDFVKARMLWEVAGSLGDPVALCFNASLYEHGLGVPRHRDLARTFYEKARSAGGCPGVDEAIARTR